jgi:hypothetical protein
MSQITIRYESSNCFIATPFELGIRHLKVAFCADTDDALLNLAKERVIFRPADCPELYPSNSTGRQYSHLNLSKRICHAAIGLLETVGYLTLIVPFIVAIADRILNQRPYDHLCKAYATHVIEGGKPLENSQLKNVPVGDEGQIVNCTEENQELMQDFRKNPFAEDGRRDPFYKGASWNIHKKVEESAKS